MTCRSPVQYIGTASFRAESARQLHGAEVDYVLQIGHHILLGYTANSSSIIQALSI